LTLTELFDTFETINSEKWDHTSLVVWAIMADKTKDRLPITAFHPYKAPKRGDSIAAFIEAHAGKDD